MPNTLAHLCVQGVATRAVFRGADLKWICLGCVIPDLPWILQRCLRLVVSEAFRYDLRLYAVVQSSLALCLVLCSAIAIWSSAPRRVFGILSLNCLLHLLLDASQTKWANGVHLFAPISWHLLNFELYWPESLPTVLLTASGLLYLVWTWRHSRGACIGPSFGHAGRLGSGTALLAAYLLLPILLFSGPESADNHSVQVLRNHSDRTGREVEFDRIAYVHRAAGDTLRTFAGEELAVAGLAQDQSGLVSVRGRFVDGGTVEILELHAHWPWFRNGASLVGLTLVASVWIIGLRGNRSSQVLRHPPPGLRDDGE